MLWLTSRVEWYSMRLAAWLVARVTFRVYGGQKDQIYKLAVSEINDLPKIIDRAITYQKNELEILSERLSRSYDPGMALNEAYNRVAVQKQKARQEAAGIMPLTSKQLAALEYQKQYLQKIVSNS